MALAVKDSDYQKVPCEENVNDELENDSPTKYGFGVRHVQALLGFGSMLVFYLVRTFIGVTIVGMTTSSNVIVADLPSSHNIAMNIMVNSTITENKDTNENLFTKEANRSDITTGANYTYSLNDTENKWNIFRTYNWSKPEQELIFSSFSVGSLMMLLPVGFLCQRLGGKLLLQIALILNIVSLVPVPWLAMWGGWEAVGGCRLLQGISYAALNPGMHTLIGAWAPGRERGRITNFVYAGSSLGTVVAHQVSGVLSDSVLGWPSVFWFTGLLCAITFAVLTVFGAASPADHKTISEEERTYILSQVKTDTKKRRVPWRAILTSRPAWATFTTHVGTAASFSFLLAQVPTYLHNVLRVDVKNSGLLTSLPFIFKFFVSFLYGYLSDLFTNKKLLSTKNSRRLFNTIAEVGVAVCLVAVTFTRDTTVAVVLFIMCMTLHAAIQSGWMLTYIDLAPNYSGFLIAVGSTLSQTFNGLLVPAVVSFVVKDLDNQLQWRTMFFTFAAMAVFCNTIYVIFLSAETQDWNNYNYEQTEKNQQSKDPELNVKHSEVLNINITK